MFLKIIYKKEVHVYHCKGEASYEALRKYIQQVFKQIPDKYQLTYFDDEDEITLACQSDLETMMQISQKTAKVYINQIDQSFYDETQKVTLDDDVRVQPLQQQIQELRLSQSQDENSVQSSEPLLQDTSNKPVVQMDDDIKSVQKSQEPMPNQNDQPEIIEEDKPLLQQKSIISESSQLNQSQVSQITQADIQQKFREMMPQFMAKVKKSLIQHSNQKQKEKIVHLRVTCDECQKNNIQGVRYKCSVCADFDLCQNCEAVSNHSHPFLKIKHPKQAPYKIFTVIQDDEQNSFEVNGHKVQLPQFPIVNQLFDTFSRSFQQYEGGLGFNFNRRNQECPFKRNYECKEEKYPEQKSESQQPQKKTKIDEDIKPQAKVESKPDKKPQGRLFSKYDPNKEFSQEKQKMENEKIIENAKYLHQILYDTIKQHECYEFARKYPTLQKEDLLNVYFSEKL